MFTLDMIGCVLHGCLSVQHDGRPSDASGSVIRLCYLNALPPCVPRGHIKGTHGPGLAQRTQHFSTQHNSSNATPALSTSARLMLIHLPMQATEEATQMCTAAWEALATRTALELWPAATPGGLALQLGLACGQGSCESNWHIQNDAGAFSTQLRNAFTHPDAPTAASMLLPAVLLALPWPWA